ncbi:MAG: TonB-dependent receptor [Gemmatimonadaceae bacterium]
MAKFCYLSLSLAGCLFAGAQLNAQAGSGSITGRVTDSTTQTPVPGVAVTIQGTRIGMLTRTDGTFSLSGVTAGAQVVQARRIGYTSQQQTVTVAEGSTATAQFALGALVTNLSPTVTIGYGTQRREAVTGSVATVNVSEANVGVQPNVNNLLQGRASGVSLTTNSGDPGAGAQVRIRGGTSISASSEPLYVIDGVPIQNASTEPEGYGIGGSPSLPRSPLNLINPNDIASITVLKDASATAIYGSRGANGVILIETKQGTGKGASIEYDGYSASMVDARRLNVLNGDQYRAFVQQQVAAGNLPASRLATLGPANTNWEDALTRTAVSQNHNLSFTGGTAETRYRASLNYLDQKGIVLNNGFKRYQGRLNGATQGFGGKLQLGLNLTASQVQHKYIPFENTGGFEGGVFENMVTFNPTRPITVPDPVTGAPVFYETGTGRQSLRNPVALTSQVDDRGTTNRTLANVTAAYTLLQGLTASVNVGVDRSGSVRQTYLPAISPVGAEFGGLARVVNRDRSNRTLQTLLTLDRSFGTQELTAVGGYEYAQDELGEFGARAQKFTTDFFGFNNLGAGSDLQLPFSFLETSTLASFFGRATYGILDRYFLTGVIRRDGSSRFGAGHKWSVFPAVSASWRISQEDFMRGNRFSDLKLRASVGLIGNQAVPPYGSLITLGTDPNARYPFGSTITTGVVPTRNANRDLKWEQTRESTVGLDYGLNDNRVTGSFEFYTRETRDLLLTVDVPQPAVVSTQLQNIGSLRNRGFEASLDAQMVNDVERTWSAGFNFAANRNKVLSLGRQAFIPTGSVSGQGQSGQVAQRIIPGYALGTFYGPEFVSVNAQGQQLFNHYVVTKDAAGNVISRVLSGTTTGDLLNGDDNVILGNANPSFDLGLHTRATWGHFDGSIQAHMVRGQKVFNNTALVYATKGNALQDKNFLRSALSDGIGIREPAIFSSRYIEDGSFFRLQNITVGYTFPTPSRVSGITSTRLYVSGDNLLLSTPYTGLDPETFTDAGLASRGIDYLTYPRARTFTTGIRIGF